MMFLQTMRLDVLSNCVVKRWLTRYATRWKWAYLYEATIGTETIFKRNGTPERFYRYPEQRDPYARYRPNNPSLCSVHRTLTFTCFFSVFWLLLPKKSDKKLWFIGELAYQESSINWVLGWRSKTYCFTNGLMWQANVTYTSIIVGERCQMEKSHPKIAAYHLEAIKQSEAERHKSAFLTFHFCM